jgi:energy-coupling factor transporter transmembrane protein EcfT
MNSTLLIFVIVVIVLFIARLLLRNALRVFKIVAFLIILSAITFVWFNKEQILSFV